MCKVSDDHLTWQQLEHAIKRNFGGFQSEELDPFAVFENYLKRDHVIVKCEPPSEAEFNSEVRYTVKSLMNVKEYIVIMVFVHRYILACIQTVQDLD